MVEVQQAVLNSRRGSLLGRPVLALMTKREGGNLITRDECVVKINELIECLLDAFGTLVTRGRPPENLNHDLELGNGCCFAK